MALKNGMNQYSEVRMNTTFQGLMGRLAWLEQGALKNFKEE